MSDRSAAVWLLIATVAFAAAVGSSVAYALAYVVVHICGGGC